MTPQQTRRVLVLVACMMLAAAAPLSAEEAKTPGGTVADLAESFGLREKVPPAPDFVAKTRAAPESMDYKPLAETPPEMIDIINATQPYYAPFKSPYTVNDIVKARQLSKGKTSADRLAEQQNATRELEAARGKAQSKARGVNRPDTAE